MSADARLGLAALGYALYYLSAAAGVVLIPLGFPGQFVVAGATLVLTLVAGSGVMPWWAVWVQFGMAAAAEGLEAAAGFFGARRARGSLRSAAGAILGGLAGAALGAPFGLVLGALFGALAGTYAGAFAAEYFATRRADHARAVGAGALAGRLVGTAVKTATALAMILLATAILIRRLL